MRTCRGYKADRLLGAAVAHAGVLSVVNSASGLAVMSAKMGNTTV